jgi:hypothetical protein
MNSIDEQMKKGFVSTSFNGPAIFAERPVIVYVTVTDVISDDWGVKATITDSCFPGMHRLRKSSCPIAAAWQIFSYSVGDWHAQYVPWRVFFDDEVIKECLALANEKAKADKAVEYDDGHKIFTEYDMRIAKELEKVANRLLRAKVR